jgi:hypothetical protein
MKRALYAIYVPYSFLISALFVPPLKEKEQIRKGSGDRVE